jgi:hypothetical protein
VEEVKESPPKKQLEEEEESFTFTPDPDFLKKIN